MKILRHPCIEGIVSLNFNKPKMQDCLRNLFYQLLCVLMLKFTADKREVKNIKMKLILHFLVLSLFPLLFTYKVLS